VGVGSRVGGVGGGDIGLFSLVFVFLIGNLLLAIIAGTRTTGQELQGLYVIMDL